MLIVSQERDSFTNFNNINLVFVDNDDNTVCCNINGINKIACLGAYATEKRALEVLQEIVNEYKTYLKLDGGPSLIRGGLDIQPNIFNVPKVYEMPQE